MVGTCFSYVCKRTRQQEVIIIPAGGNSMVFLFNFSRVLVTTDIWARGIDVQTVGLVVNYDLPQTAAVYLHRIGRSGRFGRRGIAISFVGGNGVNDDIKHLSKIATTYCIEIGPAPANLADLSNFLNNKPPTSTNHKKDGIEKADERSETVKKSKSKIKKKKAGDSTEGKLDNQSEKASVEPKQKDAGISASKKRKLRLKKNKKKRQRLAAKKHMAENSMNESK